MRSQTTAVKLTLAALAISGMFLATQAFAADIKGQVMGGGAPIAQSTVTLWAASSDAPKQLAETKTDSDGRFEVSTTGAPADSSLYLTAGGGIPAGNKAGGNNPVIALLAVVGGKPSGHA
jgi:Transthyretin-like family